MPSYPQWSLAAETNEPARHEHAPARENKTEPKPEPASAPEPVAESATPSETRKGWWQRNFKLGG
jgi:hypothetical protein